MLNIFLRNIAYNYFSRLLEVRKKANLRVNLGGFMKKILVLILLLFSFNVFASLSCPDIDLSCYKGATVGDKNADVFVGKIKVGQLWDWGDLACVPCECHRHIETAPYYYNSLCVQSLAECHDQRPYMGDGGCWASRGKIDTRTYLMVCMEYI